MGDELSTAELEGHVSLGGMTLRAVLDLTGKVNDLTETIREALIKQETTYESQGPLFLPIQGQATTPATGGVSFDIGGPTPLRRWEVRQLIVGGINYGDSRAGDVLACVAPVNPFVTGTTGTPALVSVQWAFTTLPGLETFSSGQFTLRFPDHIWMVVCNTPTATATYTAAGNVLDLPDVRSAGQVVNI